MCICVQFCIYMFIYGHVFISVFLCDAYYVLNIHAAMYIYVCFYVIHVSICVCAYTYLCIKYACVWSCIFMYAFIWYIYMCMSICACMLIHGDVCVLVFNAYVCRYMHMCDLLVRKPHFHLNKSRIRTPEIRRKVCFLPNLFTFCSGRAPACWKTPWGQQPISMLIMIMPCLSTLLLKFNPIFSPLVLCINW